MPDRRVTTKQKRAVRERAHGCCEYCCSQETFAPQPFGVEHVVPRSKRGPTVLENLAWACQGCNGHKHTKTEGVDPVSLELVPLYNPRRQRWADHFVWDSGFTRIVGLTQPGRATIETLNLNRDSLVNLRRILHAMGKHPPAFLVDMPEEENGET